MNKLETSGSTTGAIVFIPIILMVLLMYLVINYFKMCLKVKKPEKNLETGENSLECQVTREDSTTYVFNSGPPLEEAHGNHVWSQSIARNALSAIDDQYINEQSHFKATETSQMHPRFSLNQKETTSEVAGKQKHDAGDAQESEQEQNWRETPFEGFSGVMSGFTSEASSKQVFDKNELKDQIAHMIDSKVQAYGLSLKQSDHSEGNRTENKETENLRRSEGALTRTEDEKLRKFGTLKDKTSEGSVNSTMLPEFVAMIGMTENVTSITSLNCHDLGKGNNFDRETLRSETDDFDQISDKLTEVIQNKCEVALKLKDSSTETVKYPYVPQQFDKTLKSEVDAVNAVGLPEKSSLPSDSLKSIVELHLEMSTDDTNDNADKSARLANSDAYKFTTNLSEPTNHFSDTDLSEPGDQSQKMSSTKCYREIGRNSLAVDESTQTLPRSSDEVRPQIRRKRKIIGPRRLKQRPPLRTRNDSLRKTQFPYSGAVQRSPILGYTPSTLRRQSNRARNAVDKLKGQYTVYTSDKCQEKESDPPQKPKRPRKLTMPNVGTKTKGIAINSSSKIARITPSFQKIPIRKRTRVLKTQTPKHSSRNPFAIRRTSDNARSDSIQKYRTQVPSRDGDATMHDQKELQSKNALRDSLTGGLILRHVASIVSETCDKSMGCELRLQLRDIITTKLSQNYEEILNAMDDLIYESFVEAINGMPTNTSTSSNAKTREDDNDGECFAMQGKLSDGKVSEGSRDHSVSSIDKNISAPTSENKGLGDLEIEVQHTGPVNVIKYGFSPDGTDAPNITFVGLDGRQHGIMSEPFTSAVPAPTTAGVDGNDPRRGTTPEMSSKCVSPVFVDVLVDNTRDPSPIAIVIHPNDGTKESAARFGYESERGKGNIQFTGEYYLVSQQSNASEESTGSCRGATPNADQTKNNAEDDYVYQESNNARIIPSDTYTKVYPEDSRTTCALGSNVTSDENNSTKVEQIIEHNDTSFRTRGAAVSGESRVAALANNIERTSSENFFSHAAQSTGTFEELTKLKIYDHINEKALDELNQTKFQALKGSATINQKQDAISFHVPKEGAIDAFPEPTYKCIEQHYFESQNTGHPMAKRRKIHVDTKGITQSNPYSNDNRKYCNLFRKLKKRKKLRNFLQNTNCKAPNITEELKRHVNSTNNASRNIHFSTGSRRDQNVHYFRQSFKNAKLSNTTPTAPSFVQKDAVNVFKTGQGKAIGSAFRPYASASDRSQVSNIRDSITAMQNLAGIRESGQVYEGYRAGSHFIPLRDIGKGKCRLKEHVFLHNQNMDSLDDQRHRISDFPLARQENSFLKQDTLWKFGSPRESHYQRRLAADNYRYPCLSEQPFYHSQNAISPPHPCATQATQGTQYKKRPSSADSFCHQRGNTSPRSPSPYDIVLATGHSDMLVSVNASNSVKSSSQFSLGIYMGISRANSPLTVSANQCDGSPVCINEVDNVTLRYESHRRGNDLTANKTLSNKYQCASYLLDTSCKGQSSLMNKLNVDADSKSFTLELPHACTTSAASSPVCVDVLVDSSREASPLTSSAWPDSSLGYWSYEKGVNDQDTKQESKILVGEYFISNKGGISSKRYFTDFPKFGGPVISQKRLLDNSGKGNSSFSNQYQENRSPWYSFSNTDTKVLHWKSDTMRNEGQDTKNNVVSLPEENQSKLGQENLHQNHYDFALRPQNSFYETALLQTGSDWTSCQNGSHFSSEQFRSNQSHCNAHTHWAPNNFESSHGMPTFSEEANDKRVRIPSPKYISSKSVTLEFPSGFGSKSPSTVSDKSFGVTSPLSISIHTSGDETAEIEIAAEKKCSKCSTSNTYSVNSNFLYEDESNVKSAIRVQQSQTEIPSIRLITPSPEPKRISGPSGCNKDDRNTNSNTVELLHKEDSSRVPVQPQCWEIDIRPRCRNTLVQQFNEDVASLEDTGLKGPEINQHRLNLRPPEKIRYNRKQGICPRYFNTFTENQEEVGVKGKQTKSKECSELSKALRRKRFRSPRELNVSKNTKSQYKIKQSNSVQEEQKQKSYLQSNSKNHSSELRPLPNFKYCRKGLSPTRYKENRQVLSNVHTIQSKATSNVLPREEKRTPSYRPQLPALLSPFRFIRNPSFTLDVLPCSLNSRKTDSVFCTSYYRPCDVSPVVCTHGTQGSKRHGACDDDNMSVDIRMSPNSQLQVLTNENSISVASLPADSCSQLASSHDIKDRLPSPITINYSHSLCNSNVSLSNYDQSSRNCRSPHCSDGSVVEVMFSPSVSTISITTEPI